MRTINRVFFAMRDDPDSNNLENNRFQPNANVIHGNATL